ncbi:hypothetical protein PYCCODRAFT_1434769 [Trametes coccinea BRFM310]|uniref:DRBM domain-containing protein n=1 Tax=Trametes coccinea (strain BRFM310) TaxID=1353009 RepID=A0A1Y2IQE7_TRAC3|nr:hypothetical protein PYCCODRAFT_1434769 [Trametes coccinea BRFM310]
MILSFMDRRGTHIFKAPSPVWGYLPQINEWAGIHLVWECERVGGEDHIPIFRAIPVYDGERLMVFADEGESKKAAKEKAATKMALSGLCVSFWCFSVLNSAAQAQARVGSLQ